MYRLLFIPVIACLTSCELSVKMNTPGTAQSVKENMQTGLKTSANGLSFEDHYLINDKNEQLVLTQFQPGNVIAIVLTGVKNFTIVEQRAYPGLSLTVTDTSGNTVMQTGNLFENYTDGFSEKDAQTLRASLTIGAPLKEGDYKLEAKFWDTKGKGVIISKLDFSVVSENEYD